MQITPTHLTGLMFFLIFTYLLWMPASWVLMLWLTPKDLVVRFFKKPHFTSAELALFAYFPWTLMRTGIFISLCVHPHRGKRRKILNIRELVPSWYVTASKCFFYGALGQAALIYIIMIGLLIYAYFTGKF